MKIAFVSTILGYPWGGADALWTRAAAAALAQGHAVLLAVSPVVAAHPRVAALRAAGALVHERTGFTQELGRRDRWRQVFQRLVRSPQSLTAALDNFAPDHVVLCQGGVFDFLVEHGLNRWLAGTGHPFVLICQSNDDREQLAPDAQAEARRILERARATIFVSTHNRDLAARQCGAAVPRALVVPNPVELPPGPPTPWPSEIGPRLAVVARLESDPKGLDLLLDALAAIPAANWRVDLFGRGPDDAVLRARAAALGLGERLQFCGYATDIRELWATHHVLVLPSRREGCALAMLEALACGRPVIATEVGGVRDWIEPGVNGYTCPPGDTRALAATLREALAESTRWPDLGAAAARTMQARHPAAPENAVLDSILTAPRLPAWQRSGASRN